MQQVGVGEGVVGRVAMHNSNYVKWFPVSLLLARLQKTLSPTFF